MTWNISRHKGLPCTSSKLIMLKIPDQEHESQKTEKGRKVEGHTRKFQNSGVKASSFIKDLVQHTLCHTHNHSGTAT